MMLRPLRTPRPPIPGEVTGTYWPTCAYCSHQWHGLPCDHAACECPTTCINLRD